MLLADVRRRPEVRIVVAVDLLVFLEDVSQVYFVINRAYWLREFHLEVWARQWQNLPAGCQNAELFSVRTSERSCGYCLFVEWWVQYKVLILLSVPTPLVLSYYIGLGLQGSADD